MKILWLWGFIALFFTVGAMRFVMQGKLPNKPEPQRIMNVSNFQDPAQLGAVIYRRYWQEMHLENLVVLFSSPFLHEYDGIWKGLLSVAQNSDHKFSRIYEMEGLRQISQNSMVFNINDILKDLKAGQRVLLHAVATDQILSELKKNLGAGLYIVQQSLPIHEQERVEAQRLCEQNRKVIESRVEPLSCLSLNAMKRGKKKKFDPNAIVSAIEKFDIDSHVVYVHEPSH